MTKIKILQTLFTIERQGIYFKINISVVVNVDFIQYTNGTRYSTDSEGLSLLTFFLWRGKQMT